MESLADRGDHVGLLMLLVVPNDTWHVVAVDSHGPVPAEYLGRMLGHSELGFLSCFLLKNCLKMRTNLKNFQPNTSNLACILSTFVRSLTAHVFGESMLVQSIYFILKNPLKI